MRFQLILFKSLLVRLLLVSLLFITFIAAAQIEQSKIKLAESDAQVQQLVRGQDPYYANFIVDSALNFDDERVTRQYRRAKVNAWVKADFDGNGLLDLLITGTHYAKSRVICLLDMGGGSLVLEPFRRQFYRACPIVQVRYIGPQVLLEYTDFARPFLAEKLKDRRAFHLIYKYGGFIEYNPRPASQALPDSILYESFFAYHQVAEERLTLTETGAATYYSCTYPVLEEAKKTYVSQKTQVAAQALAAIQGLAGYLAGQPIQPTYHTGFNHVPRTTLTITYRNGPRLQVRDEGEIGTFGLMRLYALLHQLRKSQMWQPIGP